MEIIRRAFLSTLRSFLRLAVAIAVVVFTFGVLYVTELTVDAVSEDRHYFQHHGWPRWFALALSAMVLLFLTLHVRSRPGVVMRAVYTGLWLWPFLLAIIWFMMLMV